MINNAVNALSLFLALCIAGDVPTFRKRLFLKKIDTYENDVGNRA
jgi:hypothetical protein